MGLDIFGQSAEVEAFLKAVDDGKKPKGFKKFVKNHGFKDNKLEVLNHYFMIINIPEKMADQYSGVSVPVPRFGRHHKTVTGFGAWSQKKDFLKLFPKSTVQDIKCTGDDTCLVCQRLEEQFTRLGIEKVNKKWMAPDSASANDKAIAKQLINTVDGGLKGKKKVVFAAIVFERDKDKQWQKTFQRFVMSDFYWTRDFDKVIFESREEDKDDWCNEEHCDDTYTYNDETKPLCEFSEAEQGAIFLANTESTVPIPWDMLDGRMLHYEEIGEVQTPGVVKVKKNYPYFPPAMVKGLKGEAKKLLTAKLKQSTETYEWMIENIEELRDLDIDGYFPSKITAEEQYELLGVGKEAASTMGSATSDTVEESSAVNNVFEDQEPAAEEEVGEIGEGIEESKPDTTPPAKEDNFADDDFPF